MLKLLLILPCLILMFQPLNAKVEAPNYHFNLDTFSAFYPDKSISELDSKFGKAEVMGEERGVKTLKYKVSHERYNFPVIVQAQEGKVVDFFARLPSYFLHDVFFQSLVNRLGKQTTYKKFGEEAFYTWEAGSLKHVYSGACTITCFPIFYTVFPTEMNSNSLMQKMQKANSK